jgi:hypothetical protein
MKYIQRTMSIMILPEGENIFCETATTIAITDDAAGEFLKITQCNDESEKGEIRLSDNEWPSIRAGIDMMFKEIEKHNHTK